MDANERKLNGGATVKKSLTVRQEGSRPVRPELERLCDPSQVRNHLETLDCAEEEHIPCEALEK